MKKILWLLSFIMISIYGCGTEKPHSPGNIVFPAIAIDNKTTNTLQPTLSAPVDEPESEIKKYPLLLAIDPQKTEEPGHKEVLFSVFYEALAETFTLYNVQGQEVKLQQEVTSQDLLFEKFKQADVCIYLWGKVVEKQERVFGVTATHYFPTVECRVVDMVTGRELARLSESMGKVSSKEGSNEEKQRYAIEQAAKAVASVLKGRINTLIPQTIKEIYYIKATLAAKEEAQKLQRILQIIVAHEDIKIKKTHSESTLFDYEVISRSQGISELAEQIHENADDAGMEIWVRTSQGVIHISDHQQEEN